MQFLYQPMKLDNVQHIAIAAYNYNLPEERIAKYPLANRDASKLLEWKDGDISTHQFSDLPNLLPANSLLVFNNTKVIHARLKFQKPTGATIEVFCLTPAVPADYAQNFQQRHKCQWLCMVGNAKRWHDEPLSMVLADTVLTATKVEKRETDTLVEFSWDNASLSFSDVLEQAGNLPIPPYLNRETEAGDNETYQTVYSKIEGSVAAPTAGLHFNQRVFDDLAQKNIRKTEVTLHVGAGTFKPVKSDSIGGHTMHTEYISIDRETIQALLDNTGMLVVVGTTSMRTIESLYYLGKQVAHQPNISMSELAVKQWEPYQSDDDITPRQALRHLLDWMDKHHHTQLLSNTSIIIAPGYQFHFVDAIVTNFHQPESTLLLLISAFVGEEWKTIYDYALRNDFRFLSYGDSSLLWRKR